MSIFLCLRQRSSVKTPISNWCKYKNVILLFNCFFFWFLVVAIFPMETATRILLVDQIAKLFFPIKVLQNCKALLSDQVLTKWRVQCQTCVTVWIWSCWLHNYIYQGRYTKHFVNNANYQKNWSLSLKGHMNSKKLMNSQKIVNWGEGRRSLPWQRRRWNSVNEGLNSKHMFHLSVCITPLIKNTKVLWSRKDW